MGNGQRIAYRFYTQCLPEITELFYRFYTNGKKKVPDSLVIDKLSLAVWFMDDGSKSRSSVYLNTQQFSLEDQIKLQNILLKQHNIHSRLNKDKKYFRIRVISSDAKRFCNLVKRFIPESMEYKLVQWPRRDLINCGRSFLKNQETNTPTPKIFCKKYFRVKI